MKAKGSAFIGFAVAGALAMFTSPAFAQHHREGGGDGEQRHESAAAPRNESRGERPQQQQAQPRQQQQPQQQPQAQPRQQQQQQAQPREQRGPEQRAVPRQEFRPQYAPRYNAPQYATPRYDNRRYEGRYSSGARYYGPRYSGPRFTVAPRRFYRPYYVFRPRFSIGFGIWAGYPVTYYDPYYYPYDYYPGGGSVAVTPYPNQPNSSTGGISFDITPDDAEVWVDGNFMGHAGDYTPSSQPLGLTPGRHHLELREPGFQVSPFDVDVIPGQVIPFQGQLEQ